VAEQPVSFIDPETQRCPFAAYAKVRDEGPVYYDASCGYYLVNDYEEVRKWTADTVNLSNVTGLLLVKDMPYQPAIDAIYEKEGFLPLNTLTVSDPPLHTFHRSLVDKAFSLKRVIQMEDFLQSIVDGMIDRFIDRGECEFYSEFAVMVPINVMAHQLGFENEDAGTLKFWSETVIQEGDPNNGEARQKEITHIICQLQQFIARKAEEFEKQPGECLLSDLVHAEDNGRRMSMRELVSMVVILLSAGIDSTALAMASAIYRLIEEPGLQDELRANPDLVPNFVEEVLRLEAPVQRLYRRVLNDINIGGVDIPKGAILTLEFGAANRDPRQFADPDALQVGRANSRKHLTFGIGPHFCIGNQFARGELRIAINTLLRRMVNIRYADAEQGNKGRADWMAHFLVYGPHRLEIAFDKRSNP
jgi:cytochrome P450